MGRQRTHTEREREREREGERGGDRERNLTQRLVRERMSRFSKIMT